MKFRDRRRYPRVKLNLAVKVRKGGDEQVLQTGNISRYGMFLITNNPYAIGDEVEFETTLTPEDKPIKGRAQVMWRQTEGSGDPGMGIKIVAMSPKDMEEWAKFVETVRLAQLTEELLESVKEPHAVDASQQGTSYVVPISTINELRSVYQDIITFNKIELNTRAGKQVGERVSIVIHHPWTGTKLEMEGEVESTEPRLTVKFDELSENERLKLYLFVETGYWIDCKGNLAESVEEALAETERLARRDPLNGELRFKAALLAFFLGKTEIARDYIEGARALKFGVPAEALAVITAE